MYDIVSIGSATRDVLMQSTEIKRVEDSNFVTGQAECIGLGSKVEIKRVVFTSGGGGTNGAVTFARQGLITACIGAVADDLNGREIIDELLREGVDPQYFQIFKDGDFTAYSVILVDLNGERSILSYKGEGQHFDVSQIPFDKIQTKWLFLNSLGGHYDLLEKAVKWAAGNDVKIATNPGGRELGHGLDKLRPLLKHFNIFSVNQEEASGLTGVPYDDEMGIFKAMDELIDGIFVMTKGPEGVVVSDGNNLFKAGVPDSPVIERTGAGDAFVSGFTVEYIRSGDIPKAIQFATANSSSVVTEFGSKAGILKKDDWGPWPLVDVQVNPFQK